MTSPETTPAQALVYLDQCAAAFLRTLPEPAQGPTRQAILHAISVLEPLTKPAPTPAPEG